MTRQKYETIKASKNRKWSSPEEYDNFMGYEYHSLGFILKPLLDAPNEIWAFAQNGDRVIKIGFIDKLSAEVLLFVAK